MDDLPRTSIREATRKGVTKEQTRAAGQQKFGKPRVRQTMRDKTFVLVYSLGDEMYRWAKALAESCHLGWFSELCQELCLHPSWWVPLAVLHRVKEMVRRATPDLTEAQAGHKKFLACAYVFQGG